MLAPPRNNTRCFTVEQNKGKDMLATAPVDIALLACEMKPYTAVLYADAAKKRPISLPPGSTLRQCSDPAEGAQVLTKPDSGGTVMCVFYEFGVDGKQPEVQIGLRKAGVTKSLPDKSCPAIAYGRLSYPGKEWFFLSDGVTLPNAFKVEAKVEKEGLAYLAAQKVQGATPGTGSAEQLNLYSISPAPAIACRKNASFSEGRYAACYKAEAYSQGMGRGWTFVVALSNKGEYKFVEAYRTVVAQRPTP
jgi:hypothetical protein